MKRLVRNALHGIGYEVKRIEVDPPLIRYGVVEPEFERVHALCRPYTMTTNLEMYNLWAATNWIVDHRISGDFVECGAWRGGSAMVIAAALLAIGDRERRIFIYDTYEGMPDPSENDVAFDGDSPDVRKKIETGESGNWLEVSREEVHRNVTSTGFPDERLSLVKGKVESTIPDTVPDHIGLLRLDTDFYESTAHEMKHLYPRLSRGGILIVDDYDAWQGARRAVDEYFDSGDAPRPFLNRMDVGRIAVKP